MYKFDAVYELEVNRLCKRLHIDGDDLTGVSSREMIPELKELAEKNMDLQVRYLEGNGTFKTEIEEIDACEKQIICLVYASKKTMDIINEMGERGDYLESYIFNDLTNDMLFNASNQLNKYLTEHFREEGLFLTEKFFPGERGVNIDRQKIFLDLMKNEEDLALDINSSYMLIPEKAMMYAFGADKNNKEVSWEHDCSKCDRVDCFFREQGKDSFCPR